jgi:hypothetical protein
MIPENRRYSNFRKEARLKKWITIFGFAIVLFSWAGTAKSDSPLTVVDVVDLNRYLGMWYEIASYPSWFQKGCTGSTAEYSLLSDGKIQVITRALESITASLVGIAGGWGWTYAIKNHRLLIPEVTEQYAYHLRDRILAEPITAIITLPCAFVGPIIWEISWLSYPLVIWLVRRRRLSKKV